MSWRSIFKRIVEPSRCPQCGVYNTLDAQGRCTICGARPPAPEEDPTLTARRQAQDWWRANHDRRTAVCDRCSQDIERGEGYLVTPGAFGGSDLLCEACWYSRRGEAPPGDMTERSQDLPPQ